MANKAASQTYKQCGIESKTYHSQVVVKAATTVISVLAPELYSQSLNSPQHQAAKQLILEKLQ